MMDKVTVLREQSNLLLLAVCNGTKLKGRTGVLIKTYTDDECTDEGSW